MVLNILVVDFMPTVKPVKVMLSLNRSSLTIMYIIYFVYQRYCT